MGLTKFSLATQSQIGQCHSSADMTWHHPQQGIDFLSVSRVQHLRVNFEGGAKFVRARSAMKEPVMSERTMSFRSATEEGGVSWIKKVLSVKQGQQRRLIAAKKGARAHYPSTVPRHQSRIQR